ncbi:MAG: hypothetical protein J7L61_00340 [Thermoplasmata archaeon]|nr:hypothetical protein [Thermoplasmata archaeon]
MTTEISKELHALMAQEMGPMGRFILKKQCANLGLDPENISTGDLPGLSKAIYSAILVFTGEEKARKIEAEIRKMSRE